MIEREFSQSKLNLFLKVTARRPDGYHELETLFLPLPYPADVITVDYDGAPGIRVTSSLPGLPENLENLAGRAALAYAEAATQTPPAVDDALRSAMAAHFDARALTELTALIGLQNLSARFNAAMAIPAQGLCQIPTSSSQNKE